VSDDLRAEYERVIAELRATVAGQAEQIAELKRLLEESRRGGKRQSAPFSKGSPSTDPKRPGRKPGEGVFRRREKPAVDPDRVLSAGLPERCPCCGDRVELERVAEQWMTELPEPHVVVTRFDVEIGRCVGCDTRVQGRHEEQTSDALGAAGVMLGPRAKALAAVLHYRYGLSFIRCAEVMRALGIEVTAGGIVAASASMAKDLEPTYTAVLAAVNEASVVTMDETGWRIGGVHAWLWTATTATLTAYTVAEGRGFDDACRLVNKLFDGTLVRDGWAPYLGYTNATHQSCVAHLLRRCHNMIEALPAHERGLALDVKTLLLDALAARNLEPDALLGASADFGERLQLLLDGPGARLGADNVRLAKHLTREAKAVFTFLSNPDVDATNWRAEQAIRPAVVNRKVWGGNRTDHGARTWERLVTVLATCRQQGLDTLRVLIDLAHQPARTLAIPIH
jgi:transposase